MKIPEFNKNKKLVGAWAVSLCLSYLSSQGYTVLLPYSDIGRYDLAFDSGNGIKRVQSKFVSFKSKEKKDYVVTLQSSGYKNGERIKQIRYSIDDFDFLWVVTPDGCYMIPSEIIYSANKSRRVFVLSKKYQLYAVNLIPVETIHRLRNRHYHPQMTDSEKDTIISMYKDGKPVQEIADAVHATYNGISKFLYRLRKSGYSIGSRQ